MTTLHPNELAMLLDLSEALGSPLNLGASFARVLEILETDLKAAFGMVAFLEAETGELKVEAVTGRHDAAARKARYRLGEGISSRVVKTGKPIAVPHASQEPLFRDQLGLLASRKRAEGRPLVHLGPDPDRGTECRRTGRRSRLRETPGPRTPRESPRDRRLDARPGDARAPPPRGRARPAHGGEPPAPRGAARAVRRGQPRRDEPLRCRSCTSRSRSRRPRTRRS